MRKCTIRVYDYSNARKGASAVHYDKDNPPPIKYFDVEAYCVGGAEGVHAYFYKGDTLYEAHGDDGHWWLVGVIHLDWLKEMIDALKTLERKCKRAGIKPKKKKKLLNDAESRRIIW